MSDKIRIIGAGILAAIGAILSLASFFMATGGKELRYVSILIALTGIVLLFTRGNKKGPTKISSSEEVEDNFFEEEK